MTAVCWDGMVCSLHGMDSAPKTLLKDCIADFLDKMLSNTIDPKELLAYSQFFGVCGSSLRRVPRSGSVT